ncbi:Hypothetical protein FKW44_012014, partial [Caligus rogercresseyi]
CSQNTPATPSSSYHILGVHSQSEWPFILFISLPCSQYYESPSINPKSSDTAKSDAGS